MSFDPLRDVDIWLGLFAPSGTPDAIINELREAAHAMLAHPDFAQKPNVSGSLEPLILSPSGFPIRSNAITKTTEGS